MVRPALIFIVFFIASSLGHGAVDIQAGVKKIRLGQTLQQTVTSLGFSKKLLFDAAVPPKLHYNANDIFLLVNTPSSRRTEARFYIPYTDEAVVFWKEGTLSGVERMAVNFKVVQKVVEGTIKGSISESIIRILKDDWPSFRFTDAFSWDMNMGKQLKKGDTFKFVIEEKYDHDKFVKYGEILSAQLNTHGVMLKRVLWQSPLSKVFVDPDSRFENRPFYAPVDYVHITSQFSRKRFHPVRRRYVAHNGVDFALPEGSPIYAARDGVVLEIDKHRSNGNFITLKHDGEYFTTYNHMNSRSPLVEGQTVKAGDVIGYVGCTGYCTSSHLHFQIKQGDGLLNPVFFTKPYPFRERSFRTSQQFKELLSATL